MKRLVILLLGFVLVLSPTFAETEVPETPLVVTTKALSLEVDSAVQISYSLTDENASLVLFSSSDSEVATVSATGMISAKKAGDVVITLATSLGGHDFTETLAVNVYNLQGSLSFDYNAINLDRGASYDLEFSFTNDHLKREDIIWNSSNPTVVSVDGGRVRGNSIGTATVSATINDVTSNVTVTVVVPLVEIQFNPLDISLYPNQTVPIPDLIVVPYDTTETQTPSFVSSDPSVVEVVGSQLHAHKVGAATITATLNDVISELDVQVKPSENEFGAEIVALDAITISESEVVFTSKRLFQSEGPLYALYLPESAALTAINEKKAIVIVLPEVLLNNDMRRVERLVIGHNSLLDVADTPAVIRLESVSGEVKYQLSLPKPSEKDLNIKYRIGRVSDQSGLVNRIDGRAFELRFVTDAFPTGTKITLPADAVDANPGQAKFVYRISENATLDDEMQTVYVAENGDLTFNLDDNHFIITSNKIARSSDQTSIIVLLTIIAASAVVLSCFYYIRRRKQD